MTRATPVDGREVAGDHVDDRDVDDRDVDDRDVAGRDARPRPGPGDGPRSNGHPRPAPRPGGGRHRAGPGPSVGSARGVGQGGVGHDGVGQDGVGKGGVGQGGAAPDGGGRRRTVLQGGLWSAASQFVPAFGTAVLSVAAGRVLGSGPLGQQSLIAYVNSALTSVVLVSMTVTLLQVGGRLQGEGRLATVRRLTRWAVGAHLGIGAVLTLVLASTGQLLGQYRLAWFVVGVAVLLDAAADGLSIRIVLYEGWGPLGRRRLVFQMLGPFLGIAFLAAGQGVAGIFMGDAIAAAGLLVAIFVRYRHMPVDWAGRMLAGLPSVPAGEQAVSEQLSTAPEPSIAVPVTDEARSSMAAAVDASAPTRAGPVPNPRPADGPGRLPRRLRRLVAPARCGGSSGCSPSAR